MIAFSDQVLTIKSQDTPRHAEEVVEDIFGLRGHGPTDLDFALTTARAQLQRSRAKRRLTILLSDCKTTVGSDPLITFSQAVGADLALLDGPAGVPAAFAKLLDT